MSESRITFSELIMPFIAFIITLIITFILVPTIYNNIPSFSDYQTIGVTGILKNSLSSIIALIIFLSSIISLIAFSTVLSKITLAGGIATALGLILALLYLFGTAFMNLTIFVFILLVCLYSSYSASRTFSGLIEFRSNNIALASATSLLFIVSITAAYLAADYVWNNQDTFNNYIAETLFSQLGIEDPPDCENIEMDQCLSDFMIKKAENEIQGQYLDQFSGSFNCEQGDIFEECLLTQLAQSNPGASNTQLQDALGDQRDAVLKQFSITNNQDDFGQMEINKLVTEIMKVDKNAVKAREQVKNQLKPVLSQTKTLSKYLPIQAAFTMLFITNMLGYAVRPLSNIILAILFYFFTGIGVVKKQKKQVTVERYIVSIGPENEAEVTPAKKIKPAPKKSSVNGVVSTPIEPAPPAEPPAMPGIRKKSAEELVAPEEIESEDTDIDHEDFDKEFE